MQDNVATRPAARPLLLAAVEALLVFECARRGLGADGATPTAALAQAWLHVLLAGAAAAAVGVLPAPPGRLGAARLAAALAAALLVSAALAGAAPGRFEVGPGLAAGAAAGWALVLLLRWAMRSLAGPSAAARRVLVLGNGQEAEDVIRALNATRGRHSVEYAGLYPVMAERDPLGRTRVLDHDALVRAVADLRVTEIVVAVRERRGGVLPLRQLLDCRLAGIDVVDLVAFHERESRMLRVDLLRASWMIFGDGFEQSPMRRAAKRATDVALAATALAAGAPLWLATLVAVLLDGGAPAFDATECVGLGGRRFRRLALRTVGRDDPRRVTRSGRWLRRTGLHRWPLLVNVLRGDMSVVGPRPETPEAARSNAERVAFHAVRHAVRPGLVGWARVADARPASPVGDDGDLPFDLYYVKRHSFGLDVVILARVLHRALSGKVRDPSTRS